LLYTALEHMSETNREIILLKEIQGLKIEEIAAMLAVPVGTVKSRSNRARIELARRIRILAPSYGV
jgi:RNA polymerase sigma-70 factor (ECF subfamily)